MKDWRKLAVSPLSTIKSVVDVINRNALQVALVVDSEDKLLGTVIDGDGRRGILKGIDFNLTVS